ncbi:MAG: CDP-alcohol phosphatidyltransferase family protein [Promethearchaeota archaeon]|jgi:phosphatidylglycerophosphate synthase
MIDKWLSKTKLNKFFEKFVKKLFQGKVSANQLTLVALISGLLCALSIYLSAILIWELALVIAGAVLICISFFLDVLDGALARIEEPSIFGGILDIFSDRVVEVFIIISIISTEPLVLMWPGLFSLGAIVLCITMFLLIGGAIKAEGLEETKKVVYYRSALMERSETLVFLFLTIILVPLRSILLWIFFILVFITALLRLRDAYSILKGK